MQITLPKPPKIKEQSGSSAVFEIEELYPGYGVTVGNALRRVLYSSLPGAAITQVKLTGVSHEFSTLPGVLEDVLEITLNLKQIYVKLHGDEPQVATIKVKGAREVTAGDINAPSQIEILNKDAHIATLTSKGAQFEAEITIEPGLGYVRVEQQQKGRAGIGAIPLDAIFTPVRKVNFEVLNMRVGDRTDYNRLILEIATNGTITPQDALAYASKLLCQHFTVAGMLGESKKSEDNKKEGTKKVVKKKKQQGKKKEEKGT